MEGPIGRYARASEDYTGTTSVAHVLGACVANTISASGLCPRKQAGHLIASVWPEVCYNPDKWGAVHICNLYSITTNQEATAALFRVINRYIGNLPPMPGVFPDYPAPVVRNSGTERELVLMRWGMPPPPRTGGPPVTNIRNRRHRTGAAG
jgi:hypothetical protein